MLDGVVIGLNRIWTYSDFCAAALDYNDGSSSGLSIAGAVTQVARGNIRLNSGQ